MEYDLLRYNTIRNAYRERIKNDHRIRLRRIGIKRPPAIKKFFCNTWQYMQPKLSVSNLKRMGLYLYLLTL